MNIRLPNGRRQNHWDIYMCCWRLELGSRGVPTGNNSSWGQIGAFESATCKSALTPGTLDQL